MRSSNRHTRPGRRNHPEASYDEASRARYRVRASRPGGSGSGGSDRGLSVTRRIFLAVFGVVAARLGFLQIIDAGNLSSKAESQRTNRIVLHAKRGTIFDRNGNVLAMSEDCETIYANPKEIQDPSGVASVLADALGGEKQDYMDLIPPADTTFVYIQRQVDQDVADELHDTLVKKELAGVYFLADTKRVYPYGNVAAQILGFVNVDGEGASGLEYQYNDLLTGTDGEMLIETGRTGTPIAGGVSQVVDAKDGTDIVISLDIDLQQACESIISEAVGTYSADSGSVMVTEPRTGEILAACSTPLADFSNLQDEALSLKLVSSSFEPGSVFKVLTTSIGLDLGLYTPETVYTVPAFYKVGDNYVTDDDGRDYTEDMSVREMMRRSSNTAMAMLVTEVIGAEAFAEGVDRYGIGHATGIDFPGETEGIVRTPAEYDGGTPGSRRPHGPDRARLRVGRQRRRPHDAPLPRRQGRGGGRLAGGGAHHLGGGLRRGGRHHAHRRGRGHRQERPHRRLRHRRQDRHGRAGLRGRRLPLRLLRGLAVRLRKRFRPGGPRVRGPQPPAAPCLPVLGQRLPRRHDPGGEHPGRHARVIERKVAR